MFFMGIKIIQTRFLIGNDMASARLWKLSRSCKIRTSCDLRCKLSGSFPAVAKSDQKYVYINERSKIHWVPA